MPRIPVVESSAIVTIVCQIVFVDSLAQAPLAGLTPPRATRLLAPPADDRGLGSGWGQIQLRGRPCCRRQGRLALSVCCLRAAKEAAQWHVIQALALLPPENSRLDLGQCAVHPVAAVRAVAAIRRAKDPTVFPYERAAELARDDDHRVRRSLAQALEVNGAPMSGETQEIIRILTGDVQRSVRTLAWPGPSATGA
jgi:hypothetical protein